MVAPEWKGGGRESLGKGRRGTGSQRCSFFEESSYRVRGGAPGCSFCLGAGWGPGSRGRSLRVLGVAEPAVARALPAGGRAAALALMALLGGGATTGASWEGRPRPRRVSFQERRPPPSSLCPNTYLVFFVQKILSHTLTITHKKKKKKKKK